MDSIFLGIDTSNYRTSIAAVNSRGVVLAEKAVLLDVPEGKRGLRQSEAFFKHSNRLPGYLEEILGAVDVSGIAAIGVSDRPRRQEGSYMPCFLAGVNLAKALGSALRLPVYNFSHQEGHAAAVMLYPESQPGAGVSICGNEDPSCIFMHLSGGTTEFLLCSLDDKGYDMKIAGGTKDISFGQLIDRFGVASGLPFPSGSYIDDIAFRYISEGGESPSAAALSEVLAGRPSVLPVIKLQNGYFNLSGAETRLMNFAASDGAADKELCASVCCEIFSVTAGLLTHASSYLMAEHDASVVYLAGGIASSRTLRAMIENLSDAAGLKGRLRFGRPELSGDNAVGTALLCRRAYGMDKSRHR